MIRFKNLFLFIFVVTSIVGCTEIFTPNINSETEALIVEGLITNGIGPFTIKLSRAIPLPFDSVSAQRYGVLGAKLKITDNENQTVALLDAGYGNYTTPLAFKAKIGNSYKLYIETKDGNTYESNLEVLLPPQSYDSISGHFTIDKYLNKDNQLKDAPGADIRVNLFKSVPKSDSLPLCRFSSVIAIQYYFTQYDVDARTGNLITDWHWVCFGCESHNLNAIENITELKSMTSNSGIENHSLGFVPFGSESYGFKTLQGTTLSYYLRVNQYTMNRDTYRFYVEANNQLSANGKLFDPIATQLYGNMKCTNNPTKIVLGLFEVSSYVQSAFLVDKASNNLITISKVPFVDIPKSLNLKYKAWDIAPAPETNDPAFVKILLPSWWYHTNK